MRSEAPQQKEAWDTRGQTKASRGSARTADCVKPGALASPVQLTHSHNTADSTSLGLYQPFSTRPLCTHPTDALACAMPLNIHTSTDHTLPVTQLACHAAQRASRATLSLQYLFLKQESKAELCNVMANKSHASLDKQRR